MKEYDIAYSEFPEEPFICERLSNKFLKHKLFFPLRLDDHVLVVAASDPEDDDSLDAMGLATGFEIKALKARDEDIMKAIERHYRAGEAEVDTIIGDIEPKDLTAGVDSDDVDHLRDMAFEAPVVRLVNHIINRAVESRASDIHIEPFEKSLRVRYRIDDILHDVEEIPVGLQAVVVSRVKILANLNIAERRLPQDGKIKVRVGGKDIDLRVATMPTIHGEGVVIRILDRSGLVLDLAELGLGGERKAAFEQMIGRPYGMILVTGPTGSGKTTTLYATLDKLNTTDKKIITIEDPVEYQLHGITQIQVKPQIGLTFANGLRNIVRQDPNIILVGEIRDRETAEIAVHAALTGHLVFSTLHTNDASSAIARLLEMGLDDYLLASTLIGVVAQRLMRKICKECKRVVTPDEVQLKELKEIAGDVEGIKIYEGVGCKECVSTGYWGRTAAFEILRIDEDIRSLILKSPEASSVRAAAVRKGMKTLKQDGLRLVREGSTTIEEVLRVAQEAWD
ncbi:MAG: type II secretion system ATPase GspE [Thermodesulfobacteriota bacterium]